MTTKVTSVEGKVILSNGREVKFTLSNQYSWQQFGETRDMLCLTMPIVEAMQDAACEFIANEYEDDDQEEEA